MALLEVDGIETYYGHIQALKGVSLKVEEGEIVTLIGSNGAGKSTTLRSISGLNHARKGAVRFDGRDITHVAPQDIVQMGISQSPEGRHCFQRMTVRENLDMGAYLRRDKRVERATWTAIFSLFPRLKEREKQKAGTMSGGEQQMLAIGRALMAEPRLLLLDEPSMGIAPVLVERIYDTIEEINRERHDDPAGGAERQLRARRLEARLRAGDRRRWRCRTSPPPCARTPRCRRRTWAHDRSSPTSGRSRSTCCSSGCLRDRRRATSPAARATARRRASRRGCCSASSA